MSSENTLADVLAGNASHAIHHGDVISYMHRMPDACIDFVCTSPPFPSVFAYQSSPADLGNSEDLEHEAPLNFMFFFRALLRVMKPGRAFICHCVQIPLLKRSGKEGLFDFRGLLIRLAQRAGFIYEYDWLTRRNPQAQALRTHSHELQFAGLEKDRANARGCLCDYLIKFQTPGENAVRVDAEGEVSRNDWIKWAEGFWSDISPTDTLNTAEAKGPGDTVHICVARNSLVLTQDGYIPIQDVNVGDKVLTHKGRWRSVTAKCCNGIKPVVNVKAQGVPYLRVTPDHQLWTRQAGNDIYEHRQYAKRAEPAWMVAANTKSHYVNLKLPPIEESSYSENEWWVIGRWIGDGHWDATGGIHISCSYKETDELVGLLGKYAGSIANSGTANQIRIRDKDKRLRTMICRCGRGAASKRLPREAITLEPIRAKALLSGYLSADGCYTEQRKQWLATSVSRSLLLGMAMLFQRAYGLVASVYASRKGGKRTIQGRLVDTRDEWMLCVAHRNSSGMLLDDGAWKKVQRVTDNGEGEVWNLSVDEDLSFTVEGCIVHNCPMSLGIYHRTIRLYTNPGELVFDPFAGIGSCGFVALGGTSPRGKHYLENPRRFFGCELKDSYYRAALMNCERAIVSCKARQRTLFDSLSDESEVS